MRLGLSYLISIVKAQNRYFIDLAKTLRKLVDKN